MKIKQILNEWEDDYDPRDYEPDLPDLDYNGEIDVDISDLPGQPWSMYVNEADKEYAHGITFLVTSMDDDGVVFEVDQGKPSVSSFRQGAPATRWDPAEDDDVEWERGMANDEEVRVDDMTNNPQLKQMIPHITAALKQLKSVDEASVHAIFQPVLARLNGSK